ncbi:MAG TPA: 4'-phosphopantetheinyl transferase superfamily protein [Anaerolineales bacterium]|nr:4'-phosphopantetheinyl transferase superfamily protein [Anaerolineales bacterium]
MTSLAKRVDDSLPGQGLKAPDVHIWHTRLEQSGEAVHALRGILSEDELKRAERFHFDQHRRHFIAGRGILRHLLSLYTGIEPGQLQLEYSRNGKPFLPGMDGDSGIRFNLSHSDGMAVYAFTRGREVGIDIEHQQPIDDMDRIAERNFSAREYTTFGALPEGEQLEAFYLCWTRKEAFIKAIGEGISFPLQQFDVTLVPGEPARLLSVDGSSEKARRWSMHNLLIAKGYAGALVIEGGDGSLKQHKWEYPGQTRQE